MWERGLIQTLHFEPQPNVVAILSPSQPTFTQAFARAKADLWPIGYAMALGCNTFPGKFV